MGVMTRAGMDDAAPRSGLVRRIFVEPIAPARYRAITVAALVSVCLIIITGAAVRLSGSGLGCDDWPRCNSQRFIDVTNTHGAIEQLNRLFTFVVAAAVVAAVLGAFRRVPRRRDLTRLSILIALGVPAQGVVGGLLVLTDLNPFVNQLHMLLSLTLVALATVLVHRAGEPDGVARRPAVARDVQRHVAAITVLTGLALISGTFVTGAGPHAGDEEAKRFDVAIETVARIHGITVMTTLAVAVALLWRLRHRRAEREVLDDRVTTWMIVAISQAGIGYVQYFTDVPAVLVAIHIALATGLWLATIQLHLSTATVRPTTAPIAPPADESSRSPIVSA
jgi:cytochrome c oxidase assembly protein subunit 15